MKPFDLEKAKAGAKVVTREGRGVRIICTDVLHPVYKIAGLVMTSETMEDSKTFSISGVFNVNDKTDYDLFMAPVETVWHYAILPHVDRNLYTAPCYTTLLYETAEKLNEAINTFYKGSAILDRLTYTTKE